MAITEENPSGWCVDDDHSTCPVVEYSEIEFVEERCKCMCHNGTIL
jgi:hypothetical protein